MTRVLTGRPRSLALTLAIAGTVSIAAVGGATTQAADRIVLSIVGTTDLHGVAFPRNDRGGVALLGGYLNNLRAVRAADRGAVLLIDAGDTYQGGIESNLSEGAVVVDAYNALGYAAAAVGNHEFDFGAVDAWGWRRPGDRWMPEAAGEPDPRGALKAIAARARFPLLAANLIDAATGTRVQWPNVKASVMVEAAGFKVGIVGVMTIDALRSTLVVNVRGLRVAPLAETIRTEALRLRGDGAEVVIVAAHAGGRCNRFEQPDDVTSCEDSEIFQVAGALPRGLVDVIVAGHTHGAVAQRVNGIAIIQAYSGGRAFSRIDAMLDPQTRRMVDARIFPPRDLCAVEDSRTHTCDPADRAASLVPAEYEGRTVRPDTAVVAAMAPSLQRVRDLQAMALGPTIDTRIRRVGDQESPVANLFAEALRESVAGADVAIAISNMPGGLRADLPDGPLTFGALYDVFPFDNRVVRLTVSVAELTRVFEDEIRRERRGALAVAGMRVTTACTPEGFRVNLVRADGRRLEPGESIVVATTDFLAAGAVFAPALAPTGYYIPDDSPIAIKMVGDWLQRRGGHLREEDFVDPQNRGWDDFAAVRACSIR
jgi:5'-nucleotidase